MLQQRQQPLTEIILERTGSTGMSFFNNDNANCYGKG
jgi:hypothetical protein